MRESQIRRLIKLLEESQIEELEVSRWGRKVRLSKKASPGSVNDVGSPGTVVPAEGSIADGAVSITGETTKRAEAAVGNQKAIKSPMVGTFYRASAPESEPFVTLGQIIEKGTVVCLVEAMKLMNEIESDVSGRIVKILAEDAQPVEFGQVLFLVEAS
jgi:acetyl-CoA carboxylase biotin carboxyl carrier protein